jgi:NitT/TauT family transport system permease protein
LPPQLFKLDWVIMAILILCIIAMVLYGILNLIEKRCRR